MRNRFAHQCCCDVASSSSITPSSLVPSSSGSASSISMSSIISDPCDCDGTSNYALHVEYDVTVDVVEFTYDFALGPGVECFAFAGTTLSRFSGLMQYSGIYIVELIPSDPCGVFSVPSFQNVAVSPSFTVSEYHERGGSSCEQSSEVASIGIFGHAAPGLAEFELPLTEEGGVGAIARTFTCPVTLPAETSGNLVWVDGASLNPTVTIGTWRFWMAKVGL